MEQLWSCDNCGRNRLKSKHSEHHELCSTCKSFYDLDTLKISKPSHWISKEDITNKEKDNVNHPSHYQSKTGLEAINVIEAFTCDMTGIEAFCTGNALKYLCRWKTKNGVEDLKKAQWYLNYLINHIEKNNKTEKENK